MKSDDTYMRALGAAGLTVDDIDFVMCTHLHLDHVGWNTRLVDGEWVPTFPNARYVFSRREHAATEAANARTVNAAYEDSVLPIVRAGRADLVDDNFQLGDHVRILSTPGHTEGRCAARPTSRLRRSDGSGVGARGIGSKTRIAASFKGGRDERWRGWWGENPVYHVLVFVLTNYARAPLIMEGGTTFHFTRFGCASC